MKACAVCLLFLAGFTGPARGQDTARLLERYGDREAGLLYRVRAAAVNREGLAVLTAPEPAVHFFTPAGYDAWGSEGGGPRELEQPVDLVWMDDVVLVLDQNQHKLVSFRADGRFLSSRSLRGEWARRLYLVNSDTILGTFIPMQNARAVVRIRGSVHDTLLTYNSLDAQIRLEAEGAPSLTLSAPYAPATSWTVLADATVAFWSPERDGIGFIDGRGHDIGRIAVAGRAWPVTAADREFWFHDAIPSEFMSQRGIFEPLRRTARDVVEFPDRLPPVLELAGDPVSGLWIRKTTAATGEVWMLVSREGRARGALRFPPGRKLLAIGETGIAVLARDELDVELIEVYERPAWAQ